ncbi:MAG: hypothetical protein JST70_17465 [Bacteroidetes bacterium]|nr:hypothetical protein [Bacteroidota bacterium]
MFRKFRFIGFVLILPLIVFLTGCKITGWAPEYNETLDKQIQETAKANDRIYLELLNADKDARGYFLFSNKYIDVQSEINSIELVIEGQKNNKDLLIMIHNVQTLFEKYMGEHKKAIKPLSDGEIKIYEQYMKDAWKPLYIAEKNLKSK